MADQSTQSKTLAGEGRASVEEVALEMMKFIALTTGYGKPATAGAGFGATKSAKSSAEEYADALLELYQRCRQVIQQGR
ncbi:MAG: hypothetical protein NZV14_12475 [Bryobacteraceae bacterium]|nr:hypothetical protein [Bryobacteraceae bacterium]MDW8378969.1 hypothetical protein [Bryobacterales bacterium]